MATVYFFNGTQSGTADGSYADPYDLTQLTTQESASTSGDVFIFKDGTYALSADRTFSGGAGISYQAETDRGVIFDANGNHFVFGVSDNTGATVDFSLSGFDFIDFANGNNHAFFILMDINNTVTFNRCLIENRTSGAASGIIGKTTTTEHMNVVFNQCVLDISSSASGAEAFRDQNATSAALASLTLNGCTLRHSTGGTSNIFDRTGTTIFKNTILYGDNSGISLGTFSSLTESYNCYYNVNQSADPANNIIVDDPQFVDEPNGDFRLRPTSPCIGVGTAS